jgi:predicted nucleotide-binding protein
LSKIVERAKADGDIPSAQERLKRWKSYAIKQLSEEINPNEGKILETKRKESYIIGQPLRNFADEADMYRGFLLSLMEEIEKRPEGILFPPVGTKTMPKQVEAPSPPTSRTVFIVYGHDELNLLRLEKLLKERWRLEPIVLSSEAGKGRTLIEKFEQEAQRATYAVTLFTPDDLIEVEDKKYTQARPNVIFEMGWFYGRLGRQRVCILFKKGTKIHSDLDGIMRIEFAENVEEILPKLEKELKEAGLI